MTAPIAVSDPVRDALARGGAVVALETSVLAQGLPSPRGLEVAERTGGASLEANLVLLGSNAVLAAEVAVALAADARAT